MYQRIADKMSDPPKISDVLWTHVVVGQRIRFSLDGAGDGHDGPAPYTRAGTPHKLTWNVDEQWPALGPVNTHGAEVLSLQQ